MTELKLQQSLLDGRYELLDCLGRGSYAEIYVARDLSAAEGEPKAVVIKALNVLLQGVPDADLERTLIENFQNEAVALDRVRHPNIISRLGHGTAIDLSNTPFHYIVLEYLAGGELGERCRKEPFRLERALFYVEQVCLGLAHAHDSGVIHRDIKPQNLLLTADGQVVKIADFGVAKLEATEGIITRVGTNVYAAPEHNPLVQTGQLDIGSQSSATVQLTPAADIYSLAKTTYTLIAGQAPRRFSHNPITELPPSISEMSWARDVLRVLKRATQTRPEDRFQTVQDFWQELSDAALPPTQPLKPHDGSSALPRSPSRLTVAEAAVVKPPPRPRFHSQDLIKQSQIHENGIKRPRIVVPVAGTRPAPEFRAHPGRPIAATTSPSNVHGVDDFAVAPQYHHGGGASGQRRGFRALVASLIIIAFAGILLATHFYVTRQRALITSPAGDTSSADVGREGVANKDANLRRDPSLGSNPPLRVVRRGARVRVLSVNESSNWYDVEVLTLEGSEQDAITRGWMSKSTLDLD